MNSRRLEKTEQLLTTSELVQIWLTTAMEAHSRIESIQYSKVAEGSFLSVREDFLASIRKNLEAQAKKQKLDGKTLRESVLGELRYADLLLLLVHDRNADILGCQMRRLHHHMALLALAATLSHSSYEASVCKEAFECWRNLIEHSLREFLLLQEVTRSIASEYFSGNEILFPDARKEFLNWENHIVVLVGSHNNLARVMGLDIISLVQIREDCLREVSPCVEVIVSQARAAVFDAVGQIPKVYEAWRKWALAEP